MEVDPVLFDSLYPEKLFVVPTAPTIILDQSWESLTVPEKNLLEKILAAIKHSLNSITVRYQDSLDLSGWTEKPSRVIYFGKLVKGVPLYETIEADGVSITASENLRDLSGKEEARKKLWQALKKQFAV